MKSMPPKSDAMKLNRNQELNEIIAQKKKIEKVSLLPTNLQMETEILSGLYFENNLHELVHKVANSS